MRDDELLTLLESLDTDSPWTNHITTTVANHIASSAMTPVERKDIDVNIRPVANGFVICIEKGSVEVERIVTDYAEIGNEIMAAMAEMSLGK